MPGSDLVAVGFPHKQAAAVRTVRTSKTSPLQAGKDVAWAVDTGDGEEDMDSGFIHWIGGPGNDEV
jgi:hypothetical protein